MFKYILFDWDGCLAKTLHAWMFTYLEAYTKTGTIVTPKEILAKSWGNNEQGPKNLGIKDYESFFQKNIIDKVKIKLAHVELYQDAKEVLKQLKNLNKKICLVTSSPHKIVTPAITFHHISHLLDYIVTDDDVKKRKPDPEIINLSLLKLNGTKNEAVIIGDTDKDILAGQSAGISTILVCHDENRQFYDFNIYKKLNPTYTVSNLIQLLNIIK